MKSKRKRREVIKATGRSLTEVQAEIIFCMTFVIPGDLMSESCKEMTCLLMNCDASTQLLTKGVLFFLQVTWVAIKFTLE